MKPPTQRWSARTAPRVWFFDLDDTLHDATHAAFGPTAVAMSDYIVEHLALPLDDAIALRQHYWHRYGATLLGLVRHHGVQAAHFLAQTHQLPGLEARLRVSAPDRAALRRLPGRKFLLTNAPRAYALRVLTSLKMQRCFDGLIAIEDMTLLGVHRPKPDARLFRHLLAKLKLSAARCVLVEDTVEHQRAASRAGYTTVWMQRYLRRAADAASLPQGRVGQRLSRKPPGVDVRISALQSLYRLKPMVQGGGAH